MSFPRRVVVTGLGLVTPLGTGVNHVWSGLLAGRSGITSLKGVKHQGTGRGYEDIPSQVAALVPRGNKEGEFDVDKWVKKGDVRNMAPFMHYALSAAQQAITDSGWLPTTELEKQRTGVCFGSGIGCLDEMESTAISFAENGMRRISPYFVPKILINLAAGHISMRYGLQGPNHAASTACTTGAHSIGDAMRFIQFGDADVMVAGGSEASVSPLAMAGFAKARALCTKFNDDPEASSRPFDRDRDGFVIGEGAGCMVLEEYEHAKARGARIYAELRGYGLSSDAHHITAPPDDGRGAARSMQRALEIGGLTVEEIDYINAHATSTGLGDLSETRAIKTVFGDCSHKVAVSSTKGAIGHLLGAAGAVEAIFTVLAIVNDALPPTLNLHNPYPREDFSLDYVPLVARDMKGTNGGKGVFAALTNSFGFGGTNASLLFAKV
ncbi:beta-ketoacyl-acyl-carrier-protein synthase II [Spizellomyces punctatus DAOM BR117]|uniref:3-oxoacyl-[acyl-carrier-protein] synthase n=1 Tax=Spizellomyces punctatus (strain DAOM BR117) TaxID=645134 RepID=A0A0L0H5I2_SPIPD|nr:beta-ketoacyl-acyl-carrier-protein synthase II [Spizellomyces punctatus DAOM BR117]KNC96477.1 beta-ketoacyl-acyl-carrier-protein synthase II [Spizellomyces punctatus DAOM BR117]|eukprot:XP_016604517.1 beta-ketoacyl-acyl-carrier-protein synthase II [Spizellomyces punctatus DAOM BR117]